MAINYEKVRVFAVLVFFVAGYGALTYRLFLVQYLTNDRYVAHAQSQQTLKIKLPAQRGQILDRNGKILAISVPAKSVFAVPYEIEEPGKTADFLSDILGIPAQKTLSRLTRKKKFVWIKRKITEEQENRIMEKGKPEGIYFLEESHRVYPNKQLLSHVLGFVDIDNLGREGIEFSMNKYLSGTPGLRVSKKDAKGREIVSRIEENKPPVDGFNLELTIDSVIQHIVEKELDWGVEKFNPEGAMVVVMDVKTGDILALANRPTYDPNNVGSSSAAERRNRCITDVFEPGSVFKVVPFCAAFNEKLLVPSSQVFCEFGSYRIGSHTLNDTHSYGKISAGMVFQKSSNIGTAKIALKLGADRLYKYARDFGFGSRTRLGLAGEVAGLMYPVKNWSNLSIYTFPMGQEIAVTAVQLARAYCTIANGGKRFKPRIFTKVFSNDGQVVKQWNPTVEQRILKQDTCTKMLSLLKLVTQKEGTGRKAAIEGYTCGGKTGTAQKSLPNGRGYSKTDYFSSFVGVVPAEKPEVVIAVMFDSPKPVYYGGSVAGPVFSRIGLSIMAYLGVPENNKVAGEQAA